MLKDLTTIRLPAPIVNLETLKPFKISSPLKDKLNEKLGGKGYVFDTFTSYAITDREKQSVPAKYAVIPNQYISFACALFEFSKELNKYFEIFDNLRPYAKDLTGDAEAIKESIVSNPEALHYFDNDISSENIVHFSKFMATNIEKNPYRFGAKRLIDENGKPRTSKDCFGSVILKVSNVPDSSSSILGQLVYDLVQLDSFFEELHDICVSQQIAMPVDSNPEIVKVKLSKSFILLAGISGTGKSRFVREQVKASGSIDKNYKLISVRPDWHEPSDLLGYISRIKEEKYIVTDALKFMVSAWCDACDLGNTSEKMLANKVPSEMNTFWLCLDEMNLAPVEQYFADYLSVIETRKWDGDSYSCDAILTADVIKLLEPTAATNLRNDLGLADIKYDSLWSYFSEIGIPLPPNLIVAGTVNMDETTHGFSRKVIDRALTLDFGQFFPNDFDAFFEPTSNPVTFSFPTISQTTEFDFNDVPADSNGKESLEFLKDINTILKGTMFELAYRALNELFISVICIKPKSEIELQAVWDDFLMTKVLPRIEGDDDKLKIHNDSNSKEILKALDEYIKQKLPLIYETELRPDFFRIDATSNKPLEIKCRSREKLKWMSDRLKNNGFTTFWP